MASVAGGAAARGVARVLVLVADPVEVRSLEWATAQETDYAAGQYQATESVETMAKARSQGTRQDPAQALELARAAYQALAVAAAATVSAAKALQDQAQALADPKGQQDRADQAVEAAEECLAAAERAAQAQAEAAAAQDSATADAAQAADPDQDGRAAPE